MSRRIWLSVWFALGVLGCGAEDSSPKRDAGSDGAIQTCLEITSGPGGPCGCDLDCPAGGICATETESGMPNGMCLIECSPDEVAPEGLECRAIPGYWIYFPACGEDLACRAGWLCSADPVTSAGSCSPQCTSAAECLTGFCNRYTGLCEGITSGAGVGASCTLDEDCKSWSCATNGEIGFCWVWCNAAVGGCPEGANCESYGEEPWDDLGVCVP
jgi:hypothetical protein